MNKLAQISLIAGAAGLATAGSLDMDRSYAADLRADAGARNFLNANANPGVQVDVSARFYYGLNFRDDTSLANPDDDTTIGFGWADAEVRLSGDITDNMRGTISWNFGPGDGSAANTGAILEDVFADWTINDGFSLRVGQYIPAFSNEASTSEYNMLGAMRSVTHETLGTPSYTMGVEAHFGGDTWSGAIGFNDGHDTAGSAFNSSAEADFAFNARFDIYSDSDKARFADQTSWRGSNAGWRAGAGIYYGTFGDTNPATTTGGDSFWFTVDATYEGDGWTGRGAFYWASTDPGTGTSQDDYGFELGGSIFFDDQWEGFVRWDSLFLDDAVLSAGSEDTYNFLSGGVNYYFVPQSHAAVFTLQIAYAFEETYGATGAFDDAGFTSATGITAVGDTVNFGAANGSSGFLGSADSGEFSIYALMSLMY